MNPSQFQSGGDAVVSLCFLQHEAEDYQTTHSTQRELKRSGGAVRHAQRVDKQQDSLQ